MPPAAAVFSGPALTPAGLNIYKYIIYIKRAAGEMRNAKCEIRKKE